MTIFLEISEYCKNAEKNQYVLTKTINYSYFEKKIFKELDYEYYVINETAEDIEYKKVLGKKRGIRLSLHLLLFFLVLKVRALDLSLRYFGNEGGLLKLLGLFELQNDSDSNYYDMAGTLFWSHI
ncbi:Plasmodium exported protein (Pm-fam-a like), unknown function [Plasmodium malariae]|uniref:Uncharacterized protein n=1 Tax=Plasmodium malariae TaxID=5858 RepID=A0A1A8WNK7_PLAMA|nr:Plasmodium exported protein (Pm-fam-a like), unknown function [Plasmodium malariae]